MKTSPFILVALLASASFAPAAVFTDGNFLDSEWTMTTFPTSATGQFTERIASGGNPGAYKRVATINNNFTYNAHLRAFMTYDPAASGAITSLDWSIDFKNFNSFGLGQGYGIVLSQGGTLYRGSFFATGLAGGWQTTSQTGLTAANFTEGISGAANPNFTASGAPITFGFMTSNGNAATIDIGYDNYRVDIASVPEPATLATLSLGILAVRRRKRATN
jgi:hypothetical protein